MKIGERTREKIVSHVDTLLGLHLREIDEAFLKTDGALSVKLTSSLNPAEDGGEDDLEIKTSLSFSSSVKDSVKSITNERQDRLYDETGKGKKK